MLSEANDPCICITPPRPETSFAKNLVNRQKLHDRRYLDESIPNIKILHMSTLPPSELIN